MRQYCAADTSSYDIILNLSCKKVNTILKKCLTIWLIKYKIDIQSRGAVVCALRLWEMVDKAVVKHFALSLFKETESDS